MTGVWHISDLEITNRHIYKDIVHKMFFFLSLRWAVVADVEVPVLRVGTVGHGTADLVGAVPHNLSSATKQTKI